MKKIAYSILIFLAFQSCKSELKEIGSPSNKVDGIKSSWVLSKCVQIDEKSLTKEYADVTRFFTSGNKLPNITFSDSTYTVDTSGLSFNYFGGPSGKWQFDNNDYPTKVTFKPDGGSSFDILLNGPTRTSDPLLKFKKTISCSGSSIFTYNIEFTRK